MIMYYTDPFTCKHDPIRLAKILVDAVSGLTAYLILNYLVSLSEYPFLYFSTSSSTIERSRVFINLRTGFRRLTEGLFKRWSIASAHRNMPAGQDERSFIF